MASANDMKNGTVLQEGPDLWQIIEFQHVKPGKGPAFIRTKRRNVMTGRVVEKTYNPNEKIEITTVDRSDMQYLYEDADGYVFMDKDTYDQVTIPAAVMGDNAKFLIADENTKYVVASNSGTPLFVELPPSMVFEVTYTEPGLQGDRSNAGTKPATINTGGEIQVPLFVNIGDKIKVNTETSEYMTRV